MASSHGSSDHPAQPASGEKRVVIVEDDPRLRDYVARTLQGLETVTVVGTAGSLAEALPLTDVAPDLALLDLGLPDGHGQDFINALRAKAPACRVLVFTVFEDRASVLNALRAGADGYILKDSPTEQFLAHIEATLAGETPISARAASHLLSLVRADEPAQNTATHAPALSPRERELLEYLARGLSRKEAARVMSLSPYTVAEYIQGIYKKLQVRSRGEAVFEAIQSGMIRLDSRS